MIEVHLYNCSTRRGGRHIPLHSEMSCWILQFHYLNLNRIFAIWAPAPEFSILLAESLTGAPL